MKNLLMTIAVFASVTTSAQDASAQVNQADVILEHVVFSTQTTDGGCALRVMGHVQFPSVEPKIVHFEYDVGTVLCATVRAKGQKALEFDMRRAGVLVGDAGLP